MRKTTKTQFERKPFKRSAIAACVMTAFAVQAQAQTNDDPALLEEVVVYGIQQSLQDAQDIKREASTVKDVITSSDIGALPDRSVVEALQRVPGVAIERFEASNDPDHFSVEGGGVTVRGLNRVRSEINGRDTFSAGGDGGLNFSDIPPEMVGSVEVVKNSTADVTEGGTSGTVNLITRKPFDKEELQAAVTVKGSHGDLVDDLSPSISAIVSNVWDTDAGKFGALLSISGSNLTTSSQGIGIYNFFELREPILDANGAPVLDGEGNETFNYDTGRIAPNSASARQQFNDRDRLGISGSLQYANPSETVEATLEFIRSDSTLAWNERFIEFPAQPFTADAGPDTLVVSEDSRFNCSDPFTINGRDCQFTDGQILSNGGSVNYVAGTRNREDRRTINDISLNLQFTPNENLSLWADLQYVDAVNEIDDLTAHGKFQSDISLDIRHQDNAGLEFENDNLTDPSEYFVRSAMDHISENEGEELAFQFDAEYVFDDSWITSVKTGLRFSNREITVKESDYNWGVVSETWLGENGDVSEYSEGAVDAGLVDEFTFDDHLSGSALTGNNTFLFPSLSSLESSQFLYDSYLDNSIYRLPSWIAAPDQNADTWNPLHLRPGVVEGTSFLPSEIYVTEEERTAAYVRIDFGNEDADLPYSGNFGLRYVSWQLESTGAWNFPDAFSEMELVDGLNPSLPPEVINFSNGAAEQVNTITGDQFTRVLPSFNFKIGLTDEFIARFAASESIFLPNLNNVRNQRNIGNVVTRFEEVDAVSGETVTTGIQNEAFTVNNAGNPFLQPELSTNYDLAFEWYFADFGSLTTTFFYKNVRDYFRQATTTENITNPVSNVTQPVLVTQTVNAGKANVQGYEIALQSSFGFINDAAENFGIQASYTFIDGKANSANSQALPDDGSDEFQEVAFNNFTGLPLEGLSKENYNVALFFDNDVFQTRFAYSWRSRFLLNSRDAIAFSPVYGEATGQLDWSASVAIADNYKVGIEANNLLDEVTTTSIQYNQDGVRTPRSYFVNDRRIGLFFQASF